MKKVILLFILLLSTSVFSIGKSGIVKFDNLKYSDGKTIYFYDADGNYESKKPGTFERKIFKQEKGYIVADYYISNNQPVLIFETMEDPAKSDELKISGNSVTYYENGKIESIGKYKDGAPVGDFIYYQEDGTKFVTPALED